MFRRASRAKKEEAEAAAAAAAAAAGYRGGPPVESPPARDSGASHADSQNGVDAPKKEKSKSKKWRLKSMKKGGSAHDGAEGGGEDTPTPTMAPAGFGTLDRHASLSPSSSSPVAIPQRPGLTTTSPRGGAPPLTAAMTPPSMAPPEAGASTPPSDAAPKRGSRWGRSSKRQSTSNDATAQPPSTATFPQTAAGAEGAATAKAAAGDEQHTTVKGSYHGVIEVVSPRGDEVVVRAVAQARLLQPEGAKVMVLVRKTDLLVVSRKKGEVICNVPLSSVTYCTLDPTDPKAAAFIAPSRTGKLLCYVFVIKSKAADFPAAVSEAQTRLRGAIALQQQRTQAAHRASMARSPGQARRGSVASSVAAGPPSRSISAAAAPSSTMHGAERPPLSRSQSAAAPGQPDPTRARAASISRSPAPLHRSPSMAQAPAGMQLANGHAFGLPSRGLHFHGFYLGHEQVAAISGKSVCQEAVARNAERRRRQPRAQREPDGDPVNVIVTHHSIKTVDRRSNETISGDFLRNVAFTCVAHAELEYELFTYISQNERLGRTVCHIYRVPPRAGDSMCHAIGEAFKFLAAQDQERGNDPFAVTDPKREAVRGELFKKQIHRADLTAIKQIGAGQFGDVYLAHQSVRTSHGIRPIPRAVKLLRGAASAEDKDEFLHEAEVMLELPHQNLIQIVGVALQQKPWLCVLEFMEHGDLRTLLIDCAEKNVTLSMYEQLFFCLQLASGMEFLASHRFVHMDLAARNCMVADNNHAKVGDFGLTQRLDEGKDHFVLMKRLKLALKWVAPEGLDEKIFSEASDVWSFGVMMWEIFEYGVLPYPDVAVRDVHMHVRQGNRPTQPQNVPDKIYAIMSKCWNREWRTRWTFSSLRRVLERELSMLDPPLPERDIGAYLQDVGKGTLSKGTKLLQNPGGESSADSPPMDGRRRSRTLSSMAQSPGSLPQAGSMIRRPSIAKPPPVATPHLPERPSPASDAAMHRPSISLAGTPASVETNTDSQDAGFDLLKAALGSDDDDDLEETAGFGAVDQAMPPDLPPKNKSKRAVPPTPGSPGQTHRRLPQPPSEPRSQTHAAALRINGHQHASATTASSSASPRTAAAASATDSDSLGTEYASRAEMLQRRKQQDADIKARAAKLAAQTVDTSTETVYKALAPVPNQTTSILASAGIAAPKRSRIYEALNPKPLWHQTVTEKRKLESDVEDLGRIGDDYNARMKTAMKSAVLMETEDNFGFDAPSAPLDASDDSEEEDDQDYGEDALPDFGEISEELMARRAQREKDEQARRDQLAREYAKANREKEERLAQELAAIQARESKEEAARKAEREQGIQEAFRRAEQELVFDFAWGN